MHHSPSYVPYIDKCYNIMRNQNDTHSYGMSCIYIQYLAILYRGGSRNMLGALAQYYTPQYCKCDIRKILHKRMCDCCFRKYQCMHVSVLLISLFWCYIVLSHSPYHSSFIALIFHFVAIAVNDVGCSPSFISYVCR